MNETGAVKFQFETDGQPLASCPGFEELSAAGRELRRLGLLGVDENGIGFGNLSLRDGTTDSFYITGSGTGSLPELELKDYAKVVGWDFDRNWLRFEGRVIASAESLTHAAIYAIESSVRVVVHGHHHLLWQGLLERGPVTRATVAYGTPEMAREVQRLFQETSVRADKIFAMAGHRHGIVAFGRDFPGVLAVLTAELERTRQVLQD
jgi:L-ribulose-5-phosphate 4-epimerase